MHEPTINDSHTNKRYERTVKVDEVLVRVILDVLNKAQKRNKTPAPPHPEKTYRG